MACSGTALLTRVGERKYDILKTAVKVNGSTDLNGTPK
jgi:hypothetical protein